MFFDERSLSNENTMDESFIGLLQSPVVLASGISTKILPENPNELCENLKLSLQEKQAGNNSKLVK